MEIIDLIVRFTSHLVLIGMTYQLLITLFDWGKIVKQPTLNVGKIKLLILFISITIGFMVSNFIITIIEISQRIFLLL
ncbi:DUF1146 family protein [Streptococcus zalophi]|uniref:DUF1146 domain-containing protein n=1 Tax=Streptococcus zalophi TaxID=640031 RepID=A0A934P9D3_9STRE|nr:DUF1146 family protein [Streptococcus zalophi]MBJ8349571.1 DUF1146 domain-containing protein [Streptococcus zalophi]MCR8968079.1 DUF1146 family protein [Streptococcus zalophi]